MERGAEELIPLGGRCQGDRAGRFRDPSGLVWVIASRVEGVDLEGMQQRADTMFTE